MGFVAKGMPCLHPLHSETSGSLGYSHPERTTPRPVQLAPSSSDVSCPDKSREGPFVPSTLETKDRPVGSSRPHAISIGGHGHGAGSDLDRPGDPGSARVDAEQDPAGRVEHPHPGPAGTDLGGNTRYRNLIGDRDGLGVDAKDTAARIVDPRSCFANREVRWAHSHLGREGRGGGAGLDPRDGAGKGWCRFLPAATETPHGSLTEGKSDGRDRALSRFRHLPCGGVASRDHARFRIGAPQGASSECDADMFAAIEGKCRSHRARWVDADHRRADLRWAASEAGLNPYRASPRGHAAGRSQAVGERDLVDDLTAHRMESAERPVLGAHHPHALLGHGHRRRADPDRRNLDDAWLVGRTGCWADTLERPDREQRSAGGQRERQDADTEAAVPLPAASSAMESLEASRRKDEALAFPLERLSKVTHPRPPVVLSSSRAPAMQAHGRWPPAPQGACPPPPSCIQGSL